MKKTLLLIASLSANAYAADSTTTLQAQPLAPSAVTRTNAKAQIAGNAMSSPKIHETVATLNADGTINVGCAERPNPHAGKGPINRISPEPQQ